MGLGTPWYQGLGGEFLPEKLDSLEAQEVSQTEFEEIQSPNA